MSSSCSPTQKSLAPAHGRAGIDSTEKCFYLFSSNLSKFQSEKIRGENSLTSGSLCDADLVLSRPTCSPEVHMAHDWRSKVFFCFRDFISKTSLRCCLLFRCCLTCFSIFLFLLRSQKYFSSSLTANENSCGAFRNQAEWISSVDSFLYMLRKIYKMKAGKKGQSSSPVLEKVTRRRPVVPRLHEHSTSPVNVRLAQFLSSHRAMKMLSLSPKKGRISVLFKLVRKVRWRRSRPASTEGGLCMNEVDQNLFNLMKSARKI